MIAAAAVTVSPAASVFGYRTGWVALIVDPTLFAAVVWGTLALVVVVFVFLLYGVVHAGGIDLTDDGH